MKMIQITEKIDKMSELCEDMLMAGGKLMRCIEEMSEMSEYGERGSRYGNRYGSYDGNMRGTYGNRGDMREDEDYEMGERRRRYR